jgi:hypothetical protein
MVLPGAGHLAVGERRRGAVLLLLTLGLLAGVGLAASLGPLSLLSLLLRPGALSWLAAFNVTLLGFRLVAALDAYALGARPVVAPALPRTTGAATALLAGLAVLTAAIGAPHIVAGYYTAPAQDLIDGVFVADADTAGQTHAEPLRDEPVAGDEVLAAPTTGRPAGRPRP